VERSYTKCSMEN